VHLDGRLDRKLGPINVTFDPFIHSSVTVRDLQRRVASQSQFLLVQYKDGSEEHKLGPIELIFHPLEHERIEVREATKLAANEAIVVYRRHRGVSPQAPRDSIEKPAELTAKVQVMSAGNMGGAGAIPVLVTEAAGREGASYVERRVVHGPSVFMPNAAEWLHTFDWHGTPPASGIGKGSKTGHAGDFKVPHALQFQVIRCMPDQMYLSVRDVRTIDDASLTVHLMLFYELKSIETMLDSTNDLIGDMINSTSADVMTFASKLTYELFLQQTNELSDVVNFPILSSRMEQTGCALLKVVYRGYSASQALQEMHDQAISRRTRLRLEADAAREEQEKRSMELRCRQERSIQEQELEERAARHKLTVAALEREELIKTEDEAHSRALRYAQEKATIEFEAERAKHDEILRREREAHDLAARQLATAAAEEHKKYEGLKALGVDLTQYLCALATLKPDQHLKIDTGTTPPQVHLELPAGRWKHG